MALHRLAFLLLALILLFTLACDSDSEEEDYYDMSGPGEVEDDDDDTGGTDDDDAVDDDAVDDDAADDDATDDDDVIDGCITGDFEPAWGMLHSHSLYSDGKGTPREAYTWARDQGKLDFFALTDHLEILHIPIPPDKFEKLLPLADEFNDPGNYVAMAGFEYSLGIDLAATAQAGQFVFSAHNNVFFVDTLFPMITFDYRMFYEDLLACETCLAQFNHPGWEGQTNWDGFEYYPEVDKQMHLIEMSTWNYDPWEELFQCLDQGWHVSPTWNQDNHNKEWGTEDDHRTGAWVSELTREGFRQVMVQHRTFSTLDKTATIRMMADDVCWMGSELTGTLQASIFVEVFDSDYEDGFTVIELYGKGMELLAEFDCPGGPECTATGYANLVDDGYVIARAEQLDGDELISAPIWFSK